MKKFVIATHRTMAQGIYDTLIFFTGSDYDIRYLSAYLEDNEIDDRLIKEMIACEEDEQLIIFTDLYSGSVTQKFYPYVDQKRIFLISGINLPLILSVVLSSEEKFTSSLIDELIEDAKQQLIQVEPTERNNSEDE